MPDCIFCKIIEGELPSEKIYETEEVYCFLDANPLGKGHTLCIPKKHHQNVFEMDADLAAKLIKASKKVAQMQKDNLGADGVDFLQYNGRAGGQEVMHYHMHILPRFEEDSVDAWPETAYKKESLEATAKKLRSG
jgi:histidine triad (HIT) family protein